MTMSRCRWVRDASVPDGRYWFPQCIGGAEYGEHRCTCSAAREKADLWDEIQTIKDRLTKIERAIASKGQEP